MLLRKNPSDEVREREARWGINQVRKAIETSMSEVLPVLYVARHGETAWSLSGQHTGLTDLPLTPDGERNARRLGERLKGMTFAKVFTSPLQRAARTCELAGFGAVAETDPDLVEWNYGQYEGLALGRDSSRNAQTGNCSGTAVREANRQHKSASGPTVWSSVSAQFRETYCSFPADTFIRVLAARWLALGPDPGGRYFLLTTASLSALGYEHNLSQPVIRLWNDDHHVVA